LDAKRHEVVVQGTEVMLPPKEFALLEKLMENAGRVLTRQTLIDDVWGADYYGDTRTLDVHIKRLRAKCEEDPHDPVHLVTVRGLGYRFVP
jgi:two-component system response regulator RegX3